MQSTALKPITDRQKKVLKFISKFINEKHFPPSYREMVDGLDLASTNAVSGHLMALEHKGYLFTTRGKARAIVLSESAKQYLSDDKR